MQSLDSIFHATLREMRRTIDEKKGSGDTLYCVRHDNEEGQTDIVMVFALGQSARDLHAAMQREKMDYDSVEERESVVNGVIDELYKDRLPLTAEQRAECRREVLDRFKKAVTERVDWPDGLVQ